MSIAEDDSASLSLNDVIEDQSRCARRWQLYLFGLSNVVSGDAVSENGEWNSHDDDQSLEEGVADEIQQSMVRINAFEVLIETPIIIGWRGNVCFEC